MNVLYKKRKHNPQRREYSIMHWLEDQKNVRSLFITLILALYAKK